jgi:hypothetical protein
VSNCPRGPKANTVQHSSSRSIGQAKNPLRTAFAQLVKELIWRYGIRVRPRRRPIFLYAARRSGSTLLMEVICANPGVMFSDQPFGIYTASSANINRLPVFPYGQLAYPDDDEQHALEDYVHGLLSGRVKANAPWKFWSTEFHFRNDRICLKITDAKSMVEWMAERFDADTIIMTRHPVAQALSVAKLGWFPTGKGLLRNATFVERWLDTEREAYCWDVYRTGSDLERRTLDWALENLPMLKQLPNHDDWLYISYEDLIAHTPQVIAALAQQLELPHRERMEARVARPSRSTRRESTAERQRLIQQGDRDRLLNAWREQVTPDELSKCFRILDSLAIDLYARDTSLPDHRRVGRPGFC